MFVYSSNSETGYLLWVTGVQWAFIHLVCLSSMWDCSVLFQLLKSTTRKTGEAFTRRIDLRDLMGI